MHTYLTRFSRVNSYTHEVEETFVVFRSVRDYDTIAEDDQEALERFENRAWAALTRKPSFDNTKPGWSWWALAGSYREIG